MSALWPLSTCVLVRSYLSSPGPMSNTAPQFSSSSMSAQFCLETNLLRDGIFEGSDFMASKLDSFTTWSECNVSSGSAGKVHVFGAAATVLPSLAICGGLIGVQRSCLDSLRGSCCAGSVADNWVSGIKTRLMRNVSTKACAQWHLCPWVQAPKCEKSQQSMSRSAPQYVIANWDVPSWDGMTVTFGLRVAKLCSRDCVA